MPYISLSAHQGSAGGEGIPSQPSGTTALLIGENAAVAPCRHEPLSWADYLADAEKPISFAESASRFVAKHRAVLLWVVIAVAVLVAVAGVWGAPWKVYCEERARGAYLCPLPH
jgi:hypothetical protein